MKKLLFSAVLAASSLSALAGTMTFTTGLPAGTKVRLLLNATSATSPVTIDWGNGVGVKYTIDPSVPAYNRWTEGSIEGETITISGNITEVSMEDLGLTSAYIENMSTLTSLNLSNNELVDFRIEGVAPIASLQLNDNKIQNTVWDNSNLCLDQVGESLTTLSLYNNPGLQCLDIRDLTGLVYFSAYNCPDLASVFICMPEESRPNLRQVNLNNCTLSNFYPVSLPNLTTLDLGNNRLMASEYDDQPFTLGNYPSLTNLNVANNADIRWLDVTACPKLESLNIADNKFTIIDVSQNPELTTLVASNNKIATFDLGNNHNMGSIRIAGNPVRELDLSKFENLKSVDISNTQISRVMLMNAFYLTEFIARNTNIEFIDFNGQQAARMTKIDIRDNKNMTGETLTYTIRTLPEAKASQGAASPNLLIDGSNYENAYTDLAEDIDHHWTLDVHGNGTPTYRTVSVNLLDATDTGENKTGRLDRLYPNFGMGMDYDFDIYETEGGTFLISQWQPVWFQSMNSVSTQALAGVPIHIQAYPADGMKYKGVTVNGKQIDSDWFVVADDSDIRVNFGSEENSISFVTTPGQTLSLLVNTVKSGDSVWVDWGTGTRTEYPRQTSYNYGTTEIGGSRIDGSAAGSTVTIYGEISALDLSGFGEMAEWFGLWDNAVTSIDLGNAENLLYLSLYWNPVSNLNLAGAKNLQVLNIGYTDLKSVDLSPASNLLYVDAHSDGWGEDGISMLSDIDISGLPFLQYLDVKNNELSSLDITQNPRLWWLVATNNEISEIDLSNNLEMEHIELGGNSLSALDVTMLPELNELYVSGNDLTDLDVSANTKLTRLDISNNRIKTIDTSMLSELRTFHINGNGMNADNLNDTYYQLPQRRVIEDEEGQLSWNLAVIQGLDREENEGLRADSSIAIDRGWTPSHIGSNGGSSTAYLDILSSPNGTVTVKDAEGNEYGHGSKVPKYETLTIVAEPKTGYIYSAFSLNGEEASNASTFEMPGIYTKLTPYFVKDSGVDSVTADSTAIYATDGAVVVVAENATVDIFTAAGLHIVNAANVQGSETFGLQGGLYIVRVSSAAGVKVEKITVR